MSTETIAGAPRIARADWLERAARDGLLQVLARLHEGELTVADGELSRTFGRAAASLPVHPRLIVHAPRFWFEAAAGGALGAAQSYLRGDWDCDDLTGLVRLLARHRDLLASLDSGWSRLRTPILRGLHAARRNTERGSRRNIAAHYDLGNTFFALFLDPTLMYSSAVFPSEDASLEQASRHKLELVCRKLQLTPGLGVLEIGSGWGGFALHAAREHGVHVTTTTISREQFDETCRRVQQAGLQSRITVLLEDYRALPRLARRFDRVVSIEMIEAVGHEYLDTYLAVIDRMLERDGLALLQAIVIRDQDEAAYRRSVDFIQRHIFPGGALPSVSGITAALARATPLRFEALEDLTPHYARTLREWRTRFEAALPQVRAMGFDERFVRMWRWYLCYCEGGFLERTCGLVHLTIAGPEAARGVLAPARPLA